MATIYKLKAGYTLTATVNAPADAPAEQETEAKAIAAPKRRKAKES